MADMAAESGRATGMSGGKGSGGEGEEAMNELYKVNQVYYRMLPTLSLVAKRTLLVTSPTKSTYQGTAETITFILNSGEFYMCPTSSYLYIQIGIKNADTYRRAKALITQGNVLQLFEEVTFTSASGTEVVRELNKGTHHAFTYRYNNTQEYINTCGQVQGAPYGNYSALNDGVAPIPSTQGGGLSLDTLWGATVGGSDGTSLPRSGSAAITQYGYAATNLSVYGSAINPASGADVLSGNMQLLEFCVPLDQILGLFKPYMNILMPAGLLAGGRLDFRLKQPTEALMLIGPYIESTAGTGTLTGLNSLVDKINTDITISKVYVVMDAYQLQDNVLKRLNQVASGGDGLSLLFDSYDAVSNNASGQGSYEVNVTQARSRIVRSFNVVRDMANISNPYVNSFAAEAAIRRICGKIAPMGVNLTAYKPQPGTDNNGVVYNSVGLGGGLAFRAVKQVALLQSALPNVFNPASKDVIYQEIPYLPNDRYAGTAAVPFLNSQTVWGQEMVSSYQANLGALYFPQQPLTTAPEYYQQALYMFCKGFPDKTQTCSVTYEDFLGGLGNGLYALDNTASTTAINPTMNSAAGVWVAPYGLAVYGMLAEKSSTLQLSGLPLSNARLLRHKFTFAFPTLSGGQRRIDTFTQFTRVVKTFLGGRVVVRE